MQIYELSTVILDLIKLSSSGVDYHRFIDNNSAVELLTPH